MTKVSIIVPVYNVSNYLGKCLESLVNQSLKDIEIIVINDGSTDNSLEIAREYEKKYSNILSVYSQKNGGLSDARNHGLKYAKGKYIAFVDSDDYVKKDMFLKLYNYGVKNDLDVVVSDTIVKEDASEYILNSNLNYSDDVLKNYVIAYPMACIRLIKASVLKNFKFKKGIFYEDLEAMPSLVLKTSKIGFINYAGYYYVQHSGSIMKQKKFNSKLLDIFDVLDTNKVRLLSKYLEEVEYLYITHLLRSATLRFLDYNNCKELLKRIRKIMKKEFPNWKNNPYYKQSSFKLKLICRFAYNGHYGFLKFLKKVFNK